ncbi:ornithine decarboxylase 2-like [Venturia canescens]|uniref:ornithine decarboxylase 2-like n=1 Tax=Venturia canescens TaxID=32260 RepID=UPI001C9D48F4|nr:ornithine decarboxylase 2-like [Venturia canescens]
MAKYEFSEVLVVDDDKEKSEIIKSIVEEKDQENAFYILDVGWVVRKHCDWINKMPRVVPYFAIKCNPDATVIKTLAALDGCFDCASQREIEQVISAGVPGERIIFANPAKLVSHIKYAKKCGVDKMTVDSVQEMEKIKSVFPSAKLLIRIRNDGYCDKQSMTSLGEKFGCDPKAEAADLVKSMREMGLTLHGFSFHAGSPCPDTKAFGDGIKICRGLIDFAKTMGFQDVRLIDVGGGFLGLTDQQLDEAAASVNEALTELDPAIGVISEPGRYYVEGAFTLAALLHSRKEIVEGTEVKQVYYVNDGCYGSFIEELLHLKARVPTSLYEKEAQNAQKFISTIWGPTCDSHDCIVKDVLLPKFSIGDWMLWDRMGAYTISLACPFNGMPVADVYPFIRKSDMTFFKNALEKTRRNGHD